MNKDLSTHMAELRSILATIENKSLYEGEAGQIGKEFLQIIAGKSARQMVKQVTNDLGKKFEVTVIEKTVTKKGKTVKAPVKTVYEHVEGTESYKIIEVGGKDVSAKNIIVPVDDVVKDIEKAISQNQVVKSTEKLVKPDDPIPDITAKAETMSIEELEKKANDPSITAVARKAYKDALERKKATAPPAEIPKDKFDAAEVARKKAKGMSREELEAAVSAKNFETPAIVRKEYEAELARRGPKSATEVPGPKTGEAVLIKKENEKAIADAKQALDDGTVKVKEDDLLPKKPGETAGEQVERTLKEDPRYIDKYDSIQNTGGVAKLWNWIKDHKIASLVIAVAVAVAGYGAYIGMKPEEAEAANDDAIVDDSKETEKKRKDDAVAADEKAEAERLAALDNTPKGPEGKTDDEKKAELATLDQAAKVTAEKEVKATPEQDAELAKLKAQIDTLILELSKSKDPDILKRLAAVKAKLGQSDQAAKVVPKEGEGGWRNIGQDYERWYGPDSVDKDGQAVTRGMVRPIVYDAGEEDEYSKLSRPELLRRARIAGRQQAVKK